MGNLNGDSIALYINSQRVKEDCYGQMVGSVVERRMLNVEHCIVFILLAY